jgi:RimJ/RimL family protein N-acetyltransferase
MHGEEFWGRGIMTEAVAALTDFCFDNFPLRRISAKVFANNLNSRSLISRCDRTTRLLHRGPRGRCPIGEGRN